MNNPAITKENLLNAAEEIVKRDGLENLNIRQVAKECNISVGCIYNYFPSKSEIVFALIEKFWNTVIHKASCHKISSNNFVELVGKIYNGLYLGLEGFTTNFLNQMSILNLSDRAKGKEIEAYYWQHMKRNMVEALNEDRNINSSIWSVTFNKTDFINFVFENMMMSLRHGDSECTLLLEIIKHSLYK